MGKRSVAFVCGLVAFGVHAQTPTDRPEGALSGKIVYLHAGHGWTANNLGTGSWTTQRGESFELVEDLSNQDMHTFQAEALFNAGATVVPLRPIGHQPIEIVLDNDDPGVEFVGPWTDSVSTIFFGDAGDVPYRFAGVSATETAVARYRPTIQQAGRYPVYAWTRHGSDRVDQLYRVTHAGGVTEVRVDHRRVGNGLVYLGTYFFEAGTAGFVEISNRSDGVGVVIADMIRFGNGMGDIDRGGGVSGKPREDEAALYWIEAHAGRGIPSSEWRSDPDDGGATVGAPPRWAEQMNRQQAGSLSDRVFVSHHSNAGGGAARGVIALYNGNNFPPSATPNQFLLANTLGREINDDLVLIDEAFEHDWFNRSVVTLDRTDFEFGEINNSLINNEFDATIVERGFHDNQLDAELLLDTRVCEAVARSTTQGLVRFFRAIDGGQTPLAFAPERVEGVAATVDTTGTVTITWEVPPSGGGLGGAPTGYRVQTSTNGLGFDAGVFVPGGATTSFVEPTSGAAARYYRVVAVNDGGWSLPSAVVGARPGVGPRVLVVDGFDRVDRFQNAREPYFSGTIDRTRRLFQNNRDLAVRSVASLAAADAGLRVETAANERVISGDVALADFDAVLWVLGDESFADRAFDPIERTLAEAFVASGGALIVSGSEAVTEQAADPDGAVFLVQTLGCTPLFDDAGTRFVAGQPGTAFAGLVLGLDDGGTILDVDTPDVLFPLSGSSVTLSYAGGTGGAAGTHRLGTGGRGGVAVFGFPIEAITDVGVRDDLVARLLEALGLFDAGCLADVNGNGVADPGDFTAWVTAYNAQDAAADQNGDGLVDPSDFTAWVNNYNTGCP